MSSLFQMGRESNGSDGEKEKDEKEKEDPEKRLSGRMILRALGHSFDSKSGSGQKKEDNNKRFSMPLFFGMNPNHHESDPSLLLDNSEALSVGVEEGGEGVQERRSSIGHIANKAINASGQVMMSAVLAPVVAGKAMVHGGVKAVQGGVKAGHLVVNQSVKAGQLVVDSSVKAGQLVVDQSIKTTTTVAKAAEHTVIYGGKTVVGGGKAIVGGTSTVVEYGGKKIIKGTRGVVKGLKSAASMRGFNNVRNLELRKSKWDKGIDVIEALLQPGTDTYEAMTPDQRRELANVKKLLITGPGGGDNFAHIPRDLIKMKQRDSLSTSGDRRQSSHFILQEFAGVKDASIFGDVDSDLDVSEYSEAEGSRGRISNDSPGLRDSRAPKMDYPWTSLATLTGGSGHNIVHDDPSLNVVNFVPIEFNMISKENQMELFNMLSWNSINKWDFDIFRLNKITKRRPLLFIGWAILGSPYAQAAMATIIGLDYESAADEPHGYQFMDELMIPPQRLCNYLRVIELDYRGENAYHNAIHAADVMQTLHTLIQMSLEEEFLRDCPQIKLFTILLAAAIHDVDHPGRTNAFHTNSRTELAVMYNDTSVLENWHVAHAFARMLNMKLTGADCIHSSQVVANRYEEYKESDSETNFLCNAHPEQFNAIRNLMIEAVLHTDMSKHFGMVNAAKGVLRQERTEENTWKVLMFMLHMADISSQAKADPLFKEWTIRCMNEFFAQGDEEASLGLPISPNCDRNMTIPAESQVGFIQYVVEPAYEVLGMFVPFVENQVMNIIDCNLEYWMDQVESGAPFEASLQMDDSSRREISERRRTTYSEVFPVRSLGDIQEADSEGKTGPCEDDLTEATSANNQVEIEA